MARTEQNEETTFGARVRTRTVHAGTYPQASMCIIIIVTLAIFILQRPIPWNVDEVVVKLDPHSPDGVG